MEKIKIYENLEDKFSKKANKITKITTILISIIIIMIIFFCVLFVVLLFRSNKENGNMSHIYINPKDDYKYCIIWIHGLGDRPENHINLITEEINIPHKNNIKIILMRAPKMKMSLSGRESNSWFDIFYFPLNSSDSYNFKDAKKSSEELKKIINEEAKILGDYKKIIIGGHSQGACISLYTGYSFEKLLGGVIACSGVLFPEGEIVGDKQNLNVYLGHGDNDELIPFEFHKQSIEKIENYKGVRKYCYKGQGHFISTQEKLDIENFLNEIMI